MGKGKSELKVEPANDGRFPVNTGMSIDDRKTVARKLTRALADSFVLFINTQGTHWNSNGANFFGIHKLTEEQYRNLFDAVDEMAERIRALGEKAPASYEAYGRLSHIAARDDAATTELAIEGLIRDHEAVGSSLRSAVETCDEVSDYVTADMLTLRLGWHEKQIWLLSASRD